MTEPAVPAESRDPVPPNVAERLAAIGAQTAGVAHDVNNLLAGIDAAAALALERAGLDPATQEDLQEIRRAVGRGTALVRSLLATGARPPRPPRPRPLDPELVAAAAVIRRLLPVSVRFTTRLEATGCRVRMDPDRLHHALLNLALNARDAMHEGGSLLLRSTEQLLRRPFPTRLPVVRGAEVPSGHYAVVSLRDSGGGIPPELLARLGEPFVTARPGGTGLGLLQVREALRMAGGYLAFGGRAGQGTVVRLFLPLADPPPQPDPGAVWLVEDEPTLRRTLQRALHEAGWRVHAAASAEAALVAIGPATPRPAALVGDLTLPGMDGLGLLRALRRRWPDLPAVLVSGYAVGALPLGAAFLQKPFALADLTRLLAGLPAGSPAGSPERMAGGDS